MGNSVIWWYPGGDKAQKLDLGARISMRHGPFVAYKRTGAESMAGDIVSTQWAGRERTRLELRFGGVTHAKRLLARRLRTFVNYLQNGGFFAFAEDEDYAYASFLKGPPPVGATLLKLGQDMFGRLRTASVDLSGREVVIQSDPSSFRLEPVYIDNHVPSRGNATCTTYPVLTDFVGVEYVWVREYGSYPCLRLPLDSRDDEVLTHDREQIYYLDLPCETDLTTLAALRLAPQLGGVDGRPGRPTPPAQPGQPATPTGTKYGGKPGLWSWWQR